MQCTQCETRNPDSFKFCRECGGKLPPTVETTAAASDAAPATAEAVGTPLTSSAAAAIVNTPKPKISALAEEEAAQVGHEKMQVRVAGLLTAAFALTEQHKYNEAIPIAEEAIRLLPNSTSAYALLATLYERTDQTKQAIAAMERVIELNPDSEADQTKLDQLRRGVHVLPRPAVMVPGHDKKPAWVPALLSIGCGAAVLGVGLYLVNARLGGSDRPSLPLSSAAADATAMQTPPPPQEPQQPSLPQAAQSPQTPTPPTKGYVAPPLDNREDPFVPANGGGASKAAAPAVQSASAAPGLPRLPSPDSRRAAAATAPRFVPPVTFSPPPKVSTRGPLPPLGTGTEPTMAPSASGETSLGFGSGSRLSVGPPNTNSGGNNVSTAVQQQPQQQQQTNPNSYIRIEVKPPSSGNSGVSTRPVSPPVAAPPPVDTNPLARARRLQGAGRYSDAVAAYREAGGSGDAQQGMAQCYERLGDTGAARNAYRSALRAYEAQAGSGRNSASAQRGIASCKAALEVLGAG